MFLNSLLSHGTSKLSIIIILRSFVRVIGTTREEVLVDVDMKIGNSEAIAPPLALRVVEWWLATC
jgi:hypothetical protein